MKQVFTGEIDFDVAKLPEDDFTVLHQVYEEAPKRFETQPHQMLVLYRVGDKVMQVYHKCGVHVVTPYDKVIVPIDSESLYEIEMKCAKNYLDSDTHIVAIGATDDNRDELLVLTAKSGRTLLVDADKLNLPKLVGRACRAAQNGERVAIIYDAKLAQSQGVNSNIYAMNQLCMSSPSFATLEPQPPACK